MKEVPSLFLVPGQSKLVTKENSPETLTISAGVPGSPLSEEPINSSERGDLEENISPSRNKVRNVPPTPGKDLEKRILRGKQRTSPLGRSLDDLLKSPIWIQEEPEPTTSRTSVKNQEKKTKRNLRKEFLDLFGEITDSEEGEL